MFLVRLLQMRQHRSRELSRPPLAIGEWRFLEMEPDEWRAYVDAIARGREMKKIWEAVAVAYRVRLKLR
jgi:hypothetical protein